MPTRFDAYRMRDGQTPLAGRYFNAVFQDIDLRIAGLEDLRVSWQEVIRTVTDFGLVRINEVLAPAFDAMGDNLRQAQQHIEEIEAKRLAAVQALQGLDAAIASYQDEARADIAAWKAQTLASLATWRGQVQADLDAWQLQLQRWQQDLQATYLQNVAKPSDMAISYDVQGRPQTITETVAGQPRVSSVVFNSDGTPAQMATIYQGVTRLETYHYDAAGQMQGLSATETSA